MSEIHNYSVPLTEETMQALIKRFGLDKKKSHKEALTMAVNHALACKGRKGCDDEQ